MPLSQVQSILCIFRSKLSVLNQGREAGKTNKNEFREIPERLFVPILSFLLLFGTIQSQPKEVIGLGFILQY